MKHMWLNVPGIVPSLGQSREPFRLAGASDPGMTRSESPWRSALTSDWLLWAVVALAGVAIGVAVWWLLGRAAARLKSRRPSWTRIARAMGLDRIECGCVDRLANAAGLAEPTAVLMTPSAFSAAMATAHASLSQADQQRLVALAAKQGWPIAEIRGMSGRGAKGSATIESKPVRAGKHAIEGRVGGSVSVARRAGSPGSGASAAARKGIPPGGPSPSSPPAPSIGRRSGAGARDGRLPA